MNIEIKKTLELIKRCVESNRPTESEEFFKNLQHYFQICTDDAELELALEQLFNENYGTQVFLQISLPLKKIFKESNIILFALYRKIINEAGVKFKKFSKIVVTVLMNFITSTIVSAKEKELCVLVIDDLITNKLCECNYLGEIIDKLLNLFGNNAKNLPARFLQHTLELLGGMSKNYPGEFNVNAVYNFRDILFHTLETTLVDQKQLSFIIVSGVFKALDYYLYNFAPDLVQEPIICQKIYDRVKQISDPGEIRERQAFRRSLSLLTHHSSIMSSQLYTDHLYWHNLLLKWMKWKYDDARIAVYAMQSIHKEIANVITNHETDDRDVDILKFYLSYFKRILVTPTAKSYEIRIAIRGIGVMAKPCQKLLPENYLDDLSTLVLQRIEYTDVMTENYNSSNRDLLEYLPDFIQALSQILGYVKNLTGLQILSLQNVIIKLFKDFHFLSTIYHDLIVSSLMSTFLNIHKLDEQIFDKILDNVVMRSIIWICSSKLLVDVHWDTMTDWKDNVTIKNYTPLLKGLINPLNDEYYEISQKLYDKFIQILFKIIDKLNLKTVNRNSPNVGETGDPNIDLNPVKPKDYHIFFNLVDLYKLLLNDNMEIHTKYNFSKWIGIWYENVIEKSLEYTLVSGFLKLLSIGLKISKFINYIQFNDNLIIHLNLIVAKANQTIGDFQLSCIQLILSTPVELIVLLENYECIFANAFAIGINMIWLADYGLTILQKVVNYLHFDKPKQTKLLQEILPYFDSYLLSKVFSKKDDLKHDVMVKEYRKSKKIKKILQSQFNEDNELVKFQKKIVIFLGTLEPHICLYLLKNKTENQNSLKWDVEQKIRLRLESEQLSPIIYLDSMMPRISELALKSSNRQTKLTACELIHATVLYLIGTNNHKGEIWKRLCDILFYLGCDNDVAVQEMFEPLLIQIMHYLSQPSEINSDGSIILIESVMKVISHENNYGIRALSARCLREFLVWHIKQTPHEQIVNTAFKLNNIIEHLKLMSFDSNNCRRMGACLAFNNIYNVLREEEALINVYWLQLFYAFLINYMLTETANCDLTNNESTVNHLTRVLIEQKNIFIDINQNRAPIDKFKNNNLNGLCHWILDQMNTKLINYRRKLMQIYLQLYVNLDDLPNITDLLDQFKNKNFDLLKILDIYTWILENNLLDESFLNDSYIFKIIINYIKIHYSAFDDTIIYHMIKLMNNENFYRYIPHEMWLDDTQFHQIIITLSFAQNKLISPILNDLFDKLPRDFKNNIHSQIENEINMIIKNTIDCNFSLVCNPKKLNAIKMLLQNRKVISEIDETIRNDLLEKLKMYNDLILNASERNVLARVIGLCFMNSYSKNIINLIMNNYNFFKNHVEIITRNFLKFSKFYFNEFLINLNESTVLNIVKILNNFYTNIYNDKIMANQNDVKQLNENYYIIFDKIFNLLNNSSIVKNYEYIVIEFTINMAMICCESLEKFGSKINQNCDFKIWLYQILKSPQILAEIKVNAFNLLSCFTGPNDVTNDELMEALQEIQGKYFPLNTCELPEQSMERSQYVSLFLALLNNLVITKSPLILKFLIISTASDNKHILEWKIEENLKLFLKNNKISQQLIAINIALDLFLNENLEVTLRLNILKRFVVNLIKFSYSHTITEFYKLTIKKINELTNRPLTGRGVNIEQSIISKLGGYILIEQLFSLVAKQNIINKDGPILKAYFDNDVSKIKTGAELSRDFMKKSFSFRQEKFYSDNTEILELYRLLQCATYNCLATIICNTQEDVKFYASLLFNEKLEKNEFIWKHLINTTNENLYNFPQEFEQFPRIKDKIVSIRNIQNDNQPTKYSYIQSINVFESSLSQDVTKIDLTNSFIKSNEEISNDQNQNEYLTASVISLEKNSLNDHEIMATLCGVIKHMFDNKIVLPPDTNVVTPPIWIKSIVNSLSDHNQKNVRLFLAKLIDNCRMYFKYYAPFLFAPICKIIVDGCTGEILNFFNVDLISLLLSWNELYKPSTFEELSLISELLKFVVKNSYHPRKEIFKLHLEITKSIVELWGGIISIPIQLLFDLIDEKIDKGKIMCGINFNAIFLSNGAPPWTETTRSNFIRAIIYCINNDDNTIYQGASQLIGLCLNYLHDWSEFDQIVSDLNEMIKDIQKKNHRKAMEILYSIQKYYPKILDNFKNIIAYNIPNSVGAIKKIYLEMMLNGIELYEEEIIYNEIISIGLKDLLKHNEYQLICLHILNRAVPKFNLNNINSIFEEINGFVKCNNRDCRDVAFEILIYLNDNVHGLAKTEFETEIVKIILKKCQLSLLAGFADVDQLIKNRLYNYWTKHPKLNRDLSLRMKFIFSELYDENIEKYFLSYCCHLLLELVITRPSSKQKIIDYYPQNEFKMIEYNINTDWKSSNRSTITPIFVESQQRSVLSGDGVEMSKYLRVTQTNVMFEPTQDPSSITSMNDNFILPTHSSFAFDFSPQVLNRRSQNMISTAGSSSQDEQSESDKKLKELENKFRKRFVKTNDEAGRMQALKSVDRRNYNQSKLKIEMKRKEKSVQLYRRYRIGDHPDLSINLLALLLPLQNLAMQDSVVARQILVSIFTAIVSEDNQIALAINTSIDGILKNSKYCEPMLFGTLMEMIYHSPETCFTQPDIISTMSISNNMIICGILHLENRLLLDLEDDETSSKSSSSTLNLETKYWTKLAELYFNLRESDIVSSIYSDKLKSNPLLAKGIQNESEGNFKQAQHKYLEILNSVQNNSIEQDFCFQSFYECFSHMGQWQELSQYVQKQVNTADEFWSEWNKENCLPHYIKSELRLILNREMVSVDFLNSIENWTKDSEKLDYLKHYYGEEMMMLHFANKEYGQARLFSEKSIVNFLYDWKQLSMLSPKIRFNELLNVRNVAEIHQYINDLFCVDDEMTGNTVNIFNSLVSTLADRWNSTELSESTSVLLWDKIITYRKAVLNNLQIENKEKLDDSIINLNFKLLHIAATQNYINLYETFVKRLSFLKNSNNSANRLQWMLSNFKINMLKSRFYLDTDSDKAYRMLIKSWDKIQNELCENTSITRNINSFPIIIAGYHELHVITVNILKLIPNLPTNYDMSAVNKYSLNNVDTTRGKLFQHSLYCLEKCIALADNCYETTGLDGRKIKMDSYYTMAQFCYEFYEKGSMLEEFDIDSHLITSVLFSMQYDSIDARKLFPYLLQLKSLNDKSSQNNDRLSKLFNQEIINIPDWMFLEWISSIVSYFKYDQSNYLDELVKRLCRSYPNAVIYPFKLSIKQYMYANRIDETNLRHFLKELLYDHLNKPLQNKFIEQLIGLCIPSVKLEFHLKKLYSMIKKQNITTDEDFKYELKYFYDLIYSTENSNNQKSDCYKNITKYKQFLKELEENKFEMDKDLIETRLIEMITQLKEIRLNKNEINLSELSIWLHQYKSFENDDELGNCIEIPGQYINCDAEPQLQHHVKIIYFYKQIYVFDSLRKPIQLQIFGSNGKKYKFLVKYGEDLRQDERIQKMFHLMSKQMKLNKNCTNHALDIKIYKIIPVSRYCGITSWLENTKTLINFIRDSINRRFNAEQIQYNNEILIKVYNMYHKFIMDPSKTDPSKNLENVYGKAVTIYERNKIISNFNSVKNKLPANILKFALMEISCSPENYFGLRNKYTTSLATNSVCQWILGIGDRNLSNIMLDDKTGELISIDFGHSFGTGILNLSVPELIPFRLTPQMLYVLQPLGVTGMLSKCMIHTLRCLQQSKKLIMACMEVFVKEPILDWLDIANEELMNKNDQNQFQPSERIEIASKKLSGYNPATLTSIQLKSGVISRNENYLDKYLKLLNGIEQFNVRARLPNSNLSVEDQVAVLLDIATDPAILGIAYHGLQPYI